MAANGKSSLSSLQAALRRGPAAAKGAAVAKGGQPAPQGVKRVLVAATGAGEPVKKVIVKSVSGMPVARPATAGLPRGPAIAKGPFMLAKTAPQGLTKAPAKAGTPGMLAKAAAGGGIAKVPAPRPGMTGTIAKAPACGITKVGGTPAGLPATAKKSGAVAATASIAKVAAPRPASTPPAPGAIGGQVAVARVPAAGSDVAVPRLPDGSVALQGIRDLVGAIEGAEGHSQIRSIVRLAETMGTTMAIEHINHFLRTLKQKVQERASQSGVRVAAAVGPAVLASRPAQPTSASSPPAPAPASATKQAAINTAPLAAVAKVAASKAPASKAPVSKAPAGKAMSVVKTPALAKTPAPVVAAVTPKPPQLQPQPQAASSPSPAATNEEDLLAIVTGITENPVVEDGMIIETRLGEVLGKLWSGVAQNKHWVAAWQAMTLPVDKQSEALNKLLTMTFMQGEDSDRVPGIVAELVKAHKVKLRSVEEVLIAFGSNIDGILAINENAWQVYAHFLVHVFPKPQGTGWGWSRVGWSWQSWFKFTEQCLQSLEGDRASDVLCMIMRLIQEREGRPISEVPTWAEGDKVQRLVGKIAELGGTEVAEAVEKLAQHSIDVQLA